MKATHLKHYFKVELHRIFIRRIFTSIYQQSAHSIFMFAFSQSLYRRGEEKKNKGLVKTASLKWSCGGLSNCGEQCLISFRLVGLCWLKPTQNNPSFIPSSLLFFGYVFYLKNALKRCLRLQHTKMMRWLVLINLIFLFWAGGLSDIFQLRDFIIQFMSTARL